MPMLFYPALMMDASGRAKPRHGAPSHKCCPSPQLVLKIHDGLRIAGRVGVSNDYSAPVRIHHTVQRLGYGLIPVSEKKLDMIFYFV